jgi:predicted phosphodiesterase
MRWFIFITLFFSLLLGIFIWGSGTDVPKAAREGIQQIQDILPTPETRFLVVGDNHGVNPIYRAALARAKKEGVDFVLNLADLTEHGTEEEFAAVDELERGFGIPVYHTLGNHDIKTDATGGLYTKRFHPRWYSKDIGTVHLVVLDNADRKVGFSSAQLEWLERDLAANTKGVTIIAFHRPFGFPLAELLGDDETPASRRSNDAFRAVIAKYPVTRIFTAHIHTHATYSLDSVPVEISGGGGDPAQSSLGGPENSYFHAIIGAAGEKELKSEVIPLSATSDPS